MKKLIIALLCLFSIISCKKQDKSFEEPVPVPITSQSAQNQIDFANKHLKQITEGIALLAKDKEFVSFVQTEAKKKFDGGYEVLIQDLQKNSTWRQKMNTPKINEALNAFKNIDGANYYPQIYIPKFEYEEDMKEEKNYSASSSNIVQEYIVYIYYSGDSEVDSATNTNDSYAGYVLDSSNNLVYWGMVNEEYANNHEVWVISMNEAVGNGGNFCPPVFAKGAYQYCPESLGGCCGGGGGDDPPPPPPNCSGPDCDPLEFPSIASPPHPDMGTHFPVNFKIEYMTVRDKKEHWLAGKCEIAIRAKLHCHNNLEYGAGAPASYQPYKSDQWSNYLGKIIKQFKRKWVNDQTAQLLNYSLQTNWPTQYFLSDPVYFDYVIFERDIWPSTKNEAVRSGRIDNFWPPYGISQNWEQFYRSAQKVGTANGFPYYTGSFVSTNQLPGAYYATGYVNNSAITYNTKGY